MKKILASIATWALIVSCFAVMQAQAETPNAPVPVNDGQQFHRVNDVMYGLLPATCVGLATKRPWIGLATGIGLGVINESRYGKNFSVYHLSLISAGALAGYGFSKLERHFAKKNALKGEPWQQ